MEKANVVAASTAAAAASGAAAAALANAQNNHNAALAADQAGSTAATRAALAAAAGAIVGASANAAVASAAALDAQQYATAVAAVTAVDGVFSKAVDFQIGASGQEVMTVRLTAQLDAMHLALHGAASTYDTFGVDRPGAGTDLVIASAASASINKLQGAIDAVAGVRASLGASANRLGHADNNLANMRGNTRVAMGRVMDTDFAQESANMLSHQMLLQAGGTVLRQANSISSMVMSLLA
ncbi:flagellin [Rugamonas sp. DEMB1]|nr:flagellin [Rugamonas sp. DEMB1]WGG50896.1 flagellin [Rugamonas sp. DEMB1]